MKIVESTLNVPLTTKKLNTKIEYLAKDKQEAEEYINDLEYSLKLNKNVLNMLRDANKQPDYLENILESMERENMVFKKRLEMERETKERALRQCHDKEEQRVAQQTFYEARIAELDTRAEELRKLMHEKEVSFARIIQRLNQYEEMREEPLKSKLDNIDFSYEEGFTKKLIAKLSGEKLKLQKEAAVARRELEQYKMERDKIKKALTSRMNFYRFRETLLNSESRLLNGLMTEEQLPENAPRRATEIERSVERQYSSNPANLTRELVKLIKKEKLANDILEREFKECVEVNEEVISWNKVLIQGNKNLQARLKAHRAKIIVMEDKLKDYERHFAPLRKCRSERELVCKYTNFIDENPKKTYVETLAREVAELDLSEVYRHPSTKALSCHNSYFQEEDDHEQFAGDIEEF